MSITWKILGLGKFDLVLKASKPFFFIIIFYFNPFTKVSFVYALFLLEVKRNDFSVRLVSLELHLDIALLKSTVAFDWKILTCERSNPSNNLSEKLHHLCKT